MKNCVRVLIHLQDLEVITGKDEEEYIGWFPVLPRVGDTFFPGGFIDKSRYSEDVYERIISDCWTVKHLGWWKQETGDIVVHMTCSQIN